MSLNKNILKKLKQKTATDPDLADFLIRLFEFESESRGWYNKVYLEILEKICKETPKDANNAN